MSQISNLLSSDVCLSKVQKNKQTYEEALHMRSCCIHRSMHDFNKIAAYLFTFMIILTSNYVMTIYIKRIIKKKIKFKILNDY